jgi:hypothetical protein
MSEDPAGGEGGSPALAGEEHGKASLWLPTTLESLESLLNSLADNPIHQTRRCVCVFLDLPP